MIRNLLVALAGISCGAMMVGQQTHTRQGMETLTDHAPNFYEDYVEVESIGIPPDDEARGSAAAYEEAREAAYLRASRRLAQQLLGMYMDSTEKQLTARMREDRIEAVMREFRAPGGKVVQQSSLELFQKENMVRLVVRFNLSKTLPLLYETEGPRVIAAEEQLPKAPQPPAPPPAPEVPQPAPYDSLIIHVPADFEPSLVPQVLNSNGQLVYGATSVASEVIRAQCIPLHFSTTEDRATASLESHGAHRPLIVSGYLHNNSTTVLELDDQVAQQVMTENARGHFFERGRVYVVPGEKK